MPISWSLDDYPHFEFVRTKETVLQGLMPTGAVLQNWLDDFRYMTADHGLGRADLHLPSVRDRPRPSHADARAADRGPAREGAVFATMAEAVDEFLGRAAQLKTWCE